MVHLQEYDNLCFFLLDANQDGVRQPACTNRNGICPDKSRTIKPLLGMIRAVLNGTVEHESSTFGGVLMEEYASR